MTCSRCNGTMYSGYFMEDAFYATPIPCFRCINCGELTDPLLLQNRNSIPKNKNTTKRIPRKHFQ